ncbi:hypothetical protein HDE80_002791 [Rhodanobacter sp. A1T4]|nr:hypothetical protein [Rhodanobacter sp. A1T4]
MSDWRSLPAVEAWISDFPVPEQPVARRLLSGMLIVSSDELKKGLSSHARTLIGEHGARVGFYVEREIRKRLGVPNRLFSEPRWGVRRATGSNPLVISPLRRYKQEIGSEGIVAQLVTEWHRRFRNKALVQPSPDQIRKNKVRDLVIVTDFIGSGDRILSYLESMWRVRSIRSWHSLGLVRMHVFAYAATPMGLTRVEAHPCGPMVHLVSGCPTVATCFNGRSFRELVKFCWKRGQPRNSVEDAMGYGGVGSLIAFAHGCPNTSPLVLYRAGSSPLFPARVNSIAGFGDEAVLRLSSARQKFTSIERVQIARGEWIDRADEQALKRMLVLSAVRVSARTADSLSARTGLPTQEVAGILSQLRENSWVSVTGKITPEGIREMKRASRRVKLPYAIPQDRDVFYYPQGLRAPRV